MQKIVHLLAFLFENINKQYLSKLGKFILCFHGKTRSAFCPFNFVLEVNRLVERCMSNSSSVMWFDISPED